MLDQLTVFYCVNVNDCYCGSVKRLTIATWDLYKCNWLLTAWLCNRKWTKGKPTQSVTTMNLLFPSQEAIIIAYLTCVTVTLNGIYNCIYNYNTVGTRTKDIHRFLIANNDWRGTGRLSYNVWVSEKWLQLNVGVTQENLEPAITNKNCESLCMPLTIGSHWVVSWTIAALVYNGKVTRCFICTPERVIRVYIRKLPYTWHQFLYTYYLLFVVLNYLSKAWDDVFALMCKQTL